MSQRPSCTCFSLFVLYCSFAIIALRNVLIERTNSFLALYDVSIQNFPWLSHNLSSLRHGEVPLWDFTAYAGASHIGEMQTAALYPLELLLLPFGEPIPQYLLDCY